MESGLEIQVDEFFEKMDKEESYSIGSMACNLVPKLVRKIRELENKIEKLTYEPLECVSEEAKDYKEIWIAEITDKDKDIWSADVEGDSKEEVI